jgi:RNase P subunit RPR2
MDLHCTSCRTERRFEQPPCPDGHGADCPEWVCTDCGAALLIGLPLDVRVDKIIQSALAA